MLTAASPMRYPGGKTVLAPLLGDLLAANNLGDCIYAEPYAGGAGAGLTLLFAERVSTVLINDADPCIFAFWKSALTNTAKFLKLLEETPVTIAEWKRQRAIYRARRRHSTLRAGFATFFL